MHDFEKRSSNIELLRIVAMLIILVHHFCVHGILKVLDVSPFSLTVDNLTWQLVLSSWLDGEVICAMEFL